jgi:hypothetical protein
MERNFNNDFERFLKENADQYRLYPSTKVWNGIYSTLHTRRKWFGLGVALLLLTGTLVTLLITNSSKETILTAHKPEVKNSTPAPALHPAVTDKGISSTKGQDYNPVRAVTRNNNIVFSSMNERLASDLTIAQEGKFYVAAANSFEPVIINLTDELTDQDFLNKQTEKKTYGYPKELSNNPYNWTIESIVNSYKKRTRRLGFQFNFTPTISYRKLSANKSFLQSAALQSNTPYTYAALYDVNSAVTHKPDMGLELGFTTKYSLARNFRVKGGIQFNINRYDIKAFNYPFEQTTIALKGGGRSGVDSFRTFSSHRNFNGYSSNWLQNFYVQISMPVGVEVDLIGDDKVQFGVAGTIQPTYVLGDRAYLLSTDYKNYVEVPWLIRRWNANTAFETFVSYSTGRVKWQVGPQVRYQLLSSFVDKYPVKENLFDFGLKVGVSLNK